MIRLHSVNFHGMDEIFLMRILVACEYSGRVRDAFIAKGHDAISCDLAPTKSNGPHIVGNVLDIIDDKWDMIIAFPPCQYLSCIGAATWYKFQREQREAMRFALSIWKADCDKVVIENPRGKMREALNRKATQFIHPWMFGEPFMKMTGLWIRGLPPLKATVSVKPDDAIPYIERQTQSTSIGRVVVNNFRVRDSDRSLTFLSIAKAMADQWG